MDSYYIDGSDRDSRLQPRSRSRSNSHLTSTTAQFQDLNIKPSIKSSNEEEEKVSKGPTTATTSTTSTPTTPRPTTASTFLDPDPQQSSTTFIASPVPKQVTPFPDFSQAELDANWLFAEPEDTTGPTPIVRLEPAQNLPSSLSLGSHSSISRSNSYPASMSTIGIQNYDPRFDAGVQQSFTWPRFDLGDQFLPQQMSPPMAAGTLTPGYDPKLMPMYARSISSSPPRPNLTPEQRELKRQRDVARRDSKVRMRRDRSTSNPYTLSPQPSPEMLSRSLSEFSNGLTPSPLLSQGSQGSPSMSNISSPAYLSGYTPGMGDPTSSDMYGPAFTMPPDFNGMPAYAMPYPNGSMDSGLPSFMPRPHSLSAGSDQQPNMQHMQSLYQNPSPKMGSSDLADHARVVHSRPKPQCWEHGCNGRQFSTFSNLLRHQREKSGAATKATCPNCGAEFTRTTARNGHMAHEKCKQRRTS